MYKRIKLVIGTLILLILMQMGYSQSTQIDLEGHRGCRGLMPENSIPAMLEALKWGVTTLEMDVVITKDKQVVLSHEPYMNLEIATPAFSLPNFAKSKDYNIFQMTYEEVKSWDVGTKFNSKFPEQQKIKAIKPLLKEVIKEVEAYIQQNGLQLVRYNIETKIDEATDGIYHPSPKEFVDLLTSVIIEAGIAQRTIIQSFDPRSLVELHKMNAPFQLSYLVEHTNLLKVEDVVSRLGFKPQIISPSFTMINKKFIDEFHQHGIQVIVWTVNKEEDILSMAALGVDGIISDYPNRFAVLKGKKRN